MTLRGRDLGAGLAVLVVVLVSALALLRPASASPQISLEGTDTGMSTSTSVSVSATSANVGDLMILQVTHADNINIAGPPGWQIRGAARGNQSGSSLEQTVLTKVATILDVGATFAVTSNASNATWGLHATLAVYSGVDSANPIRNFNARVWPEASSMDIDYTSPPDYTDGLEDVVFISATVEEPSIVPSALGVLNPRAALFAAGSASIYDNANNFSNTGPFVFTSSASPSVEGTLILLGLNPSGAPATTYSLSGSVFDDKTGDGVGAAGVGSTANPFVTTVPNVDVYRDDGDGVLDGGDTLIAAMTPTAGTFSVPGLANDTYFVVVDGPSVSGSTTVLSEQTWAPAGGLCDDGAGGVAERVSAGSCYGGADASISDDPSSIGAREHVAKVVINGANVAGLDFGFSNRVVTNSRPTGVDDYPATAHRAQGTFRQFIDNANALPGRDDMRFVPVDPPDDVDANGDGFWEIGGGNILTIDDDATFIWGDPYDPADGVTPLVTNGVSPPPFVAGTSPMTGIGDQQPPQLFLHGPNLVVNADGVLISDLAVHTPWGTALWMHGDSGSVQAVYVGLNPRGEVPPTAAGEVGIDLFGSGGFIDDSWIAGQVIAAVQVEPVAGPWTLTDSLITDNPGSGAIDVDGSSSFTIRGTRIEGNALNGIWTKPSTGPLILDEVSIVSNGETGALIEGSANITNSVFSANGGAGVRVAPTATVSASQSHFDNSEGAHNADLSIDLLGTSEQVHGGTPPYATPNDTFDNDTGGNDLLNKPVIESAVVAGGSLTLIGWAPTGSTVEIFRSSEHPSGFGGAETFVGTFVEGGVLDNDGATSGYQNASGTETSASRFSVWIPFVTLAAGQSVSATATRSGMTSEFSQSFMTTGAGTTTTIDVDVLLDEGADGLGPFVTDGWSVALYEDDGDGAPGPGDFAVDVSSSLTPLTAQAYGTHWLVLNPSTHVPSSGPLPTDVWPEQIAGDVGSLCWDVDAAATVELTAAGPCVGGRSVASDDDASLATREHVIRVEATGSPVTKTLTMSYDAVTVVRDGDDDLGSARTIQGSFRQFIQNANAGMARRFRFIPIEPANLVDGVGSSWRVSATSAFPAVTANAVEVIGDAYDWSDYGSRVDPRPGGVAVPAMGTAAISQSDIGHPELTITGGDLLFDQAHNSWINYIAIENPGGIALELRDVQNVVIDSSFLGIGATGAVSNAGPTLEGVRLENTSAGHLKHSLVRGNSEAGVFVSSGAPGLTISESLIEDNAGVTGLSAVHTDSQVNIDRTAVVSNGSGGVQLLAGADASTITASNVVDNGGSATGPDAGVHAQADDVTITESVIRDNGGAGVFVTAVAADIVVSESVFSGNGSSTGQIGIDLSVGGDDQLVGSAPFRSLNDDGDTDAGGNELLNTVVFDGAVIDSGDVHLRGFAPAGSTIEVFVASTDNPDPEGMTYLVSLLEGGAADTDSTTESYSTARGSESAAERFAFQIPLPVGVVAGTDLVATATTASGTSEFSDAVAVVQSSAPVLGPGNVFTVAEGATLFTPIPAVDPDPGDTIAFQLNAGPDPLPTGLSISFSSGTLIWSTPSEAVGPSVHNLTVLATDSYGNSTLFPITVVVTETNSPPVLSTVPGGVTVTAGSSFASTPTVADPDLPANSHVWSVVGLPPGLVLDPVTGQMTGTIPASTPSGLYTVSLTATDDGSPALSDTQTFTITVVGLEAPVANAGPDVVLAPGQSYDLLGLATDSDGTISSWQWTGAASESFLPASTQDILGASWTAPGTYPLVLQVTDNDGLTDDDSLVVTVTSGAVTASLVDLSSVMPAGDWQPAVSVTLTNDFGEPVLLPLVVTVEYLLSDGTILTAVCTTSSMTSVCEPQVGPQSILLAGATATVAAVSGPNLDSWTGDTLPLMNSGYVPPTTTTTTAPPTTTTTAPPTTTTTTAPPTTTTTTAPPTTTTVPPPTTTTAPPTTTTSPPTTTTAPPTTTTVPPTTTSTTVPPTTTTFVVPPPTTTTTFLVPPPTTTTTTTEPPTTTTTSTTTAAVATTTTTTTAPPVKVFVTVPSTTTTSTTAPPVTVFVTVPPTTTTTSTTTAPPVATTAPAAPPPVTVPVTTAPTLPPTTVPDRLAFVTTIEAVDDEVFVLDGEHVMIDVLANDAVSPAGPLRVVSVSAPSVGRIDPQRDGTVRFTAPDGWTGVTRATYVVRSSDGSEATGSIKIVVGAPVAVSDSVTFDDYRPRTIEVLANDVAMPGERLEVRSFTQVNGGLVELQDDGRLVFTPDPGFVGRAAFTYEIIDGSGRTAIGEVVVNVPEAAASAAAARARSVGADLLSVDVDAADLAAPDLEPAPTLGDEGLVLFVSAVFQQLGALRLPVLRAALAILWAGIFAGLVIPMSRRSSMWRVHDVPRGQTLNAVSAPGGDEVVFRLAADAVDIWSTGRTRKADGRRWRKIDTPNGPAWVPTDRLLRSRSTRSSRIDAPAP